MNKNNKERTTGLWLSMFMSAVIPMALGLFLSNMFSNWRWSNYPFHSMVESVGSLSALTIATLMIIMLKNRQLPRYHIMVACALISMGLLDGFHAVLHVGVSFVWLHSVATFAGGIMFAMVWCSEDKFTDERQKILLFSSILFSLLLGIISVVFPNILPEMVTNGSFSTTAKVINLTGGIGFLVGSLYFVKDYKKVKKEEFDGKVKTEDMVFANHCLLFGIAGLLFETSVLWDAGWWWWHILRLMAYLVVLVYFFILFNRRQKEFIRSEEKLQKTLNEQVNESANNRMLFDVSPVGLALTDMEGNLVDVNQAYADILGRTIHECYPLKYWDVTPPKYEAQENNQLEHLQKNGRYGPYEKEYLHKDGHLVPVRLSGIIIERNEKSYIWSSIENISDEKKAYSELEYNQLRFAAMFESLTDAVVVADTNRRITIVNGAAKKFFGYDELDLLGNATSMLYAHPEDFSQTGKQRYNPDAKGDPLPFEVEYKRKDGSIFCGETLGTKIISEDGEVYGFVGIIRDITDRKKSDKKLKLSASRLNEAQHLAKLGSWELDLESNELVWSDEIFNIFGIDSNEFSASYEAFLEAIHPDDRDEVNQAYTRSLETRKPYEITHRLQMKDGTIKHVRETCESFFDENSKPLRSVGTVQDITEIVIVEEELENHREHLEELVAERTNELHSAQDELVRKERLATLGQLTATVSHELRNPLGAIRPSLYIIEKKSDKDDERMQKAIQRVDRNVDRCDNIIDELLDFTRITKLKLELTRFDDWLDQVIVEQDVPDGIILKKNFNLSNVELSIDSDRLRRVIINVIDNGCHAMMDDNHQVVSSNACLTVMTSESEHHFEIKISDTGIGISKAVLDKIFEPLFSTKGFGVGLGMSTVKQIMEQHHGGIEVNSEENKGTQVILRLPKNNSNGRGDTV